MAMRRAVWGSGLVVGAALAQASLFPPFPLGVYPHPVLVLVVAWGMLAGTREGLLWAFLGGSLVDLFSGAPLGPAALALVLVTFLASTSSAGLFRGHLLLAVGIVFGATVAYALLYLALLGSVPVTSTWLHMLGLTVVPAALLNAALTPPVYTCLARLERATRPPPAVEW